MEVRQGEFGGVGLDEGWNGLAGARRIEAPTVVRAHEFALTDATGGKPCAFMRASDIRREESTLGEARQDELRFE